ncbi:ATP-dependent DNA ligase [Niallia sp. Sow4_A1]|uniref:DNA ligase (ATP) n=1 Tax=Niallia hominis TaxID=3133173 RepID=A0ABV1F712_9BACI|nr:MULTISPECIES: RNA ligase family protein [Bacillaceae]MCF2650167.1 DNA ligase [Niallia circulans]MCM3364903.1 DNA ligase [Niallia sp. MER TA 168]CAI9394770.1 DNA ligase C1 [Bacillus sp. T2.9-1]
MKPIKPFEPILTDVIPQGDQWVAQVKWDGTRILTYYDGDKTQLFNRKKNERTKQYPELLRPNTFIQAENCILDGEIIALQNGKPSFYEVMKRDRIRNMDRVSQLQQEIPITYMIFDILYVNDHWLLEKPLRERQQILRERITENEVIRLVESFSDTEGLFNVCMEHQLEGIVCKDLDSPYLLEGKDSRWRKRKKEQDLIAVVGGVTLKNKTVHSLHLGQFNKDGQLFYIGSAGSGKLTAKDWVAVTNAIEPIIIKENPFINQVEVKGSVWLRPALTVKITFLEWTEGRTLRHPVIESFVTVPIEECLME